MSPKSRREFLKRASLVGGIALTCGPALPAQEKDADDPLERQARAFMELIRARFAGQELGGEMNAIEEDVRYNLQAGQALRSIPLINGDEPDFTFVPE